MTRRVVKKNRRTRRKSKNRQRYRQRGGQVAGKPVPDVTAEMVNAEITRALGLSNATIQGFQPYLQSVAEALYPQIYIEFQKLYNSSTPSQQEELRGLSRMTMEFVQFMLSFNLTRKVNIDAFIAKVAAAASDPAPPSISISEYNMAQAVNEEFTRFKVLSDSILTVLLTDIQARGRTFLSQFESEWTKIFNTSTPEQQAKLTPSIKDFIMKIVAYRVQVGADIDALIVNAKAAAGTTAPTTIVEPTTTGAAPTTLPPPLPLPPPAPPLPLPPLPFPPKT